MHPNALLDDNIDTIRGDVVQLLEAIAGGGFSSESAGKLNLSASHLERMKSVRRAISECSLRDTPDNVEQTPGFL